MSAPFPPAQNSGSGTPTGLTPGERVARLIIRFFAGIKSLFELLVYPSGSRPQGQVIIHRGSKPSAGMPIRFPRILIVEDNLNVSSEMKHAVMQHYGHGEIHIFLAYGIQAAITYFTEADIPLVVMDNDLADEQGDGVFLTRKFKEMRPEVIIIANSSSTISNLKMTSCGASHAMNKKRKQFIRWLEENDPQEPAEAP